MTGQSLVSLRAGGYDVRISANAELAVEGTIANGASNQAVNFGNLANVTSIEINNDTANRDLVVKVNGNGIGFTIKGSESKTIDEALITSMTLSNASGASIDYRIHLWGFNA